VRERRETVREKEKRDSEREREREKREERREKREERREKREEGYQHGGIIYDPVGTKYMTAKSLFHAHVHWWAKKERNR